MNLRSLIPVGRNRTALTAQTNPFVSLQQEIERLFDDFGGSFSGFGEKGNLVPRMDVTETDKAIEVTAELPGLEEKDVEINLADDLLTIRGEKKSEKEEKDKNYHLVERNYGSFSRSIQLPAGVKSDAIQASIAKGVLKVTVPKPEPSVTKKIEVKAAA
ncbi:MAG: Hsp20/alpha crystallin family protein [Hyphomicrobiales bacterium]